MSAKLTFNITNDAAAALERLSTQLDISKTEVLRKAISLYDAVERETRTTDPSNRKPLGIFNDDEKLTKQILVL